MTPSSGADQMPDPSSDATDHAGKPVVVVVADDEPDLVMIVQLKLGQAGMNCVIATDGLAAEQLIREHRPQLAILDVAMPRQTGLDVTRSLRADGIDVPIILLSARAANDDVDAGLAAGCNAYVTKPFSPSQLLDMAKELIEPASGDRATLPG